MREGSESVREDEPPTDIPFFLPSEQSIREDQREYSPHAKHILDTGNRKREGAREKDK